MNISHPWLVLVPFAAFAAAFSFGAVALWIIGKRTKITQTETSAGNAVHVASPIGMLDVEPAKKLDDRLARIPVYPGAMPEDTAAAESIARLQLGGKLLEEISTSYWTPDDSKQVWEFYREQLSDWPQNLDGTQGGKELIRREQDYVLLVRVSGRPDRTIIDTCIKPPGYPHLFERGYR